MNSCVHIYCGDGKGKTTAAVGLAVRAAGCGKTVMITRFLKTDHSGEVEALAFLPGISVTPCGENFGFFFSMTEEQKKNAAFHFSKVLEMTLKKAKEEAFDMLVLDEVVAAMNYGLVSEKKVCDFIAARPVCQEVILTGRDPSKRLIALADYVSEIRKIKHPYDRGMGAREGIEF